MWHATASPRRPVAVISAATASQFSSLRLATTTSAPASANPSAIALPSPRPPPVTMAVFPVRSKRFRSDMLRDLTVPGVNERLYFRQLLAGRDFAAADPIAQQMVNFVYVVGDRETGEAVAIDPAYGVRELVDLIAADGLRLTDVLVTHYHPDHVGGSMGGWTIEGLAELLALDDVHAKVHVQAEEAYGVKRVTGASDSDLVLHASGDTVTVGAVPITLIHTPGHTPGSQCFFVDGRLVAGDTLFLDGCGRTDLPGGDPAALYESITQKLAIVPDDATLYPGHMYSPAPAAPMGDVRRNNHVFRPKTREQWMAVFGNDGFCPVRAGNDAMVDPRRDPAGVRGRTGRVGPASRAHARDRHDHR